jgi:hypothetical protein
VGIAHFFPSAFSSLQKSGMNLSRIDSIFLRPEKLQ